MRQLHTVLLEQRRSSDECASEEEQQGISMPAPACSLCRGMRRLRADVAYGHPLFGKSTACTCWIQRQAVLRRRQLRQEANLDTFRTSTFASFDGLVPGVQDALRVSQHYAAEPRGWLLLVGPCGCGKTHLAAAIANQYLANGATVYFTSVPDLLDALRSTFGASEQYTHFFMRVCEVELLVLDDLGVQQSTAWSNEKLLHLLDYRTKLALPTIITAVLKEILKLDEQIRSYVLDGRLITCVRIDTAQDYRSQKKPEKEETVKVCTSP
jgi:DNA replication protein DnaC